MTILDLKEGQKALVKSIMAGKNAESRLSNFGIIPDEKIKLIKKPLLGAIEIEIQNSKVILGKGLASKVIVTTQNE